MSRALRRAALGVAAGAVAVLGAVGCGGGEAQAGAHLGFGITISRAVADEATGFQVALLSNGSSVDCATVQQSCLSSNASVPDEAFVRLTDEGGQQKKVLFFSNALDGGTQNVALEGLSPGKNFAVVVEAIAPGRLLGSACKYVAEIRSGSNPRVLASIQPVPADAGTCDPAFP
jgi:hypothetical protein